MTNTVTKPKRQRVKRQRTYAWEYTSQFPTKTNILLKAEYENTVVPLGKTVKIGY